MFVGVSKFKDPAIRPLRVAHLDAERLAKVTDHHTKLSLRLQEAFGLRREEAIKFSPSYADKGDKIVLKASWTKGGKAREIPVRSEEQRQLLDEVRAFVGRGALIPANKNYYQQMRTYERNTSKAGLDKNHGLRHAYVHKRYEELTGWKCPAAGGPARRSLNPQDRAKDDEARQKRLKEDPIRQLFAEENLGKGLSHNCLNAPSH